MQETRNNCFRSKICSKTLRQVNTGKHEFRNVIATQNNCCEILASSGVILKSDHQSYFKTPVCSASSLYKNLYQVYILHYI